MCYSSALHLEAPKELLEITKSVLRSEHCQCSGREAAEWNWLHVFYVIVQVCAHPWCYFSRASVLVIARNTCLLLSPKSKIPYLINV